MKQVLIILLTLSYVLAHSQSTSTNRAKTQKRESASKSTSSGKPAKKPFLFEGVVVEADGYQDERTVVEPYGTKKEMFLEIPCESIKEVENVPWDIIKNAMNKLGFEYYDKDDRDSKLGLDLLFYARFNEKLSAANYKVKDVETLEKLKNTLIFYNNRVKGKMTKGLLQQILIGTTFLEPKWSQGKANYVFDFTFAVTGYFTYSDKIEDPIVTHNMLSNMFFDALREEVLSRPGLVYWGSLNEKMKADRLNRNVLGRPGVTPSNSQVSPGLIENNRPSTGISVLTLAASGQAMKSSSSGTYFAYAESMRGVKIIKTIDKKVIHQGLAGEMRNSAICFSPNEQVIAVLGQESPRTGTVRLIDVSSGKMIRDLQAERVQFHPILNYSKSGKYIYAAGLDGLVRSWDSSTGSLKHRFPDKVGNHFFITTPKKGWNQANSIASTSDDKWLFIGMGDGHISIWDQISGKKEKEIENLKEAVVSIIPVGTGFVAIDRSGQGIVVGDGFKVINSFDIPNVLTILGILPNESSNLITLIEMNGRVRLFDPSNGVVTKIETAGGKGPFRDFFKNEKEGISLISQSGDVSIIDLK
jgi:hypothetical protein